MYAHLMKHMIIPKTHLDHYLKLGHEIHTPEEWRLRFDLPLTPKRLVINPAARVSFWDWLLSYKELLDPLPIPPREYAAEMEYEIENPLMKSVRIFKDVFQIDIDQSLDVDERHHDVTARVRERNLGKDYDYKAMMMIQAEERVQEEQEEWDELENIRARNRMRMQHNDNAVLKNIARQEIIDDNENRALVITNVARRWIREQQHRERTLLGDVAWDTLPQI